MKKITYLFLIGLISIFVGCKKTDNVFQDNTMLKESITQQSDAKQVAYAEKYLKKIATEIAILNKNENFKNFVRTETRKKFDDEYEVLINDLKSNPTWGPSLNSKNMNEGIEAFQNVDGIKDYNFFPQIYIPKFQYDEEENNSSSLSILASIGGVKYVIYGGNSEVDTATNTAQRYPAYTLDSTNTLQYWGMVNEQYANTNEVWILSLNEVVNTQGRLILAAPPCGDMDNPCTGGGSGSGGGSNPDDDPAENFRPIHPSVDDALHGPVKCRITYMVVRESKESWLAGASEVSIKAALNCHNNRSLGAATPAEFLQYRSNQYSNKLGKLIRKFKRREINQQSVITVNYPLQAGWPTSNWQTDPIFFDYIVFEKDNWPAPFKTEIMDGRRDYWYTPNNTQFYGAWNYDYRSNNPTGTTWGFPYAKGFFSSVQNSTLQVTNGQFYNNGSVNNSEISFNTSGY